jgi:adenylate kinase
MPDQPPVIVLLGPPGSGKGTQAERLEEHPGFVPLSPGALLREARDRGTELGVTAAQYIDRGELVPDDIVAEMMRDAISGLDGRPIALDGFPRTVAQADALAGILDGVGRELAGAILIDLPDDEVVERISHRHQGRADDRPETVRNRLRIYHEATEPLVAYYDHRGLLRRVDGSGSVDDVETRVRGAIDSP